MNCAAFLCFACIIMKLVYVTVTQKTSRLINLHNDFSLKPYIVDISDNSVKTIPQVY